MRKLHVDIYADVHADMCVLIWIRVMYLYECSNERAYVCVYLCSHLYSYVHRDIVYEQEAQSAYCAVIYGKG